MPLMPNGHINSSHTWGEVYGEMLSAHKILLKFINNRPVRISEYVSGGFFSVYEIQIGQLQTLLFLPHDPSFFVPSDITSTTSVSTLYTKKSLRCWSLALWPANTYRHLLF